MDGGAGIDPFDRGEQAAADPKKRHLDGQNAFQQFDFEMIPGKIYAIYFWMHRYCAILSN